MSNNINKTFCENTIKEIDKKGYFKAWHPDMVAKRLNDYLGEEKYIGCIKSGLVYKIVEFYGAGCGVCCDCCGMCKKIMEGA